MRKKSLIIAAAAAALVLILVLAGLPVFSKLYYGRSQAATLFAWQLKKEAYTTEYVFQEYLLEKQLENELPYTAPEEAGERFSLDSGWCGLVKYYVLNAEGSAGKQIVYFAGGSYIDQPRPVHWQFLNDIAEDTGAAIVVPIYPKLPAADASVSYEAMKKFYAEVVAAMDCDERIFMGDSAGGGMALSLAMQLRDEGLPGPDKLILICPWLDVTLSNPDIPAYEKKDPALDAAQLRHLGALWAGDLAPTDPVVSPLYGSFQDLGAITLVTGTGELLYPDIKLLSDTLADQGIGHDLIVGSGMFHVWPLYHDYSIPEAEETYADIVRILYAPAE